MSTKEARHCPKCGSVMSYRLGEFDCPSCGHTESAAPQKEERSWGSSSDSVNRARLLAPPTAPPPPGSSGFNLGGTPPDDMYGGGTSGTSGIGRDSLHTEKLIFMGLQVVSTLILIVMAVSLGSMADAGGLGIGALIGGLLAALAINLVLYGFVLFSDAIWIKWTCLGCQTIGLIGAFVGIFAPEAAGAAMGGGSVGTFMRIFQFVYVLWFASIIYRDIMSRQEY